MKLIQYVPTNIFMNYENALAFLIKQNKKQKIENRNIIRKRRRITWPYLRPTGRPSTVLAQCQSSSSSRQEDEGVCPAPAATRRPPPACLLPPRPPWRRHDTPGTPLDFSHSLRCPPSSALSSSRVRAELVAAVRRCRGHQHPHARPVSP